MFTWPKASCPGPASSRVRWRNESVTGTILAVTALHRSSASGRLTGWSGHDTGPVRHSAGPWSSTPIGPSPSRVGTFGGGGIGSTHRRSRCRGRRIPARGNGLCQVTSRPVAGTSPRRMRGRDPSSLRCPRREGRRRSCAAHARHRRTRGGRRPQFDLGRRHRDDVGRVPPSMVAHVAGYRRHGRSAVQRPPFAPRPGSRSAPSPAPPRVRRPATDRDRQPRCLPSADEVPVARAHSSTSARRAPPPGPGDRARER